MAAAQGRPGGRLGIGEVVRVLAADFPDVSISKIRFLEAAGLVEPARTPSGYRKFSHAEVERLRYVLSAQRDHYLPLRVIREHLDAMDRGLVPPEAAGELPRAPRAAAHPASGDDDRRVQMSRAELLADSGIESDLLGELEDYAVLGPETDGHYDALALEIATAAARLAEHGLEGRHLRSFKTAADREVSLVDQVVAPIARSRDPETAASADEVRSELIALAARLHVAVVRAAARPGG